MGRKYSVGIRTRVRAAVGPLFQCYTYHGLFGSASQNTYISCLGHDDASSVSFVWANACAVLPRPVSGAFHAERVLMEYMDLVEAETDGDERKRLMANYNMLSTAKTTITAVSSNLYSSSGIGVTLLLLGFCFAYVGKSPTGRRTA